MIHREGYIFLTVCVLVLAALSWVSSIYLGTWAWLIYVLSAGLTLFLLYFFRNPDRRLSATSEELIYAPADGKVVVIEETTEMEYLKDRRIQISIFMSPLNVHVNRNPVSGSVIYQKYHAGKFMPAWNPKSSLENERTTIVYETSNGKVGMRQIAGALARRIVCYLKQGDAVQQDDDMGFIKLGSRVDLLLPLGTEINVSIGDVVEGNVTVIGKL